MPAKTQENLKTLVSGKRGFVVVSAPPGGGLTALVNATGGSIDRFMRSVVGAEDEAPNSGTLAIAGASPYAGYTYSFSLGATLNLYNLTVDIDQGATNSSTLNVPGGQTVDACVSGALIDIYGEIV